MGVIATLVILETNQNLVKYSKGPGGTVRRCGRTSPLPPGMPSLQDKALLVNFLNGDSESATEALRAFRFFKDIRSGKGPMSCYSLKRLIKSFEETGSLETKPRSGKPSTCKSVAVTVLQNAEAIETLSTYGEVDSSDPNITATMVWLGKQALLVCSDYWHHDIAEYDFLPSLESIITTCVIPSVLGMDAPGSWCYQGCTGRKARPRTGSARAGGLRVPSHPVLSPISSRAQCHLIACSVPSHPVIIHISSRDHSHLIPCSVPSQPVVSPISSRGQSHLIPCSVPFHSVLSPISSRAQSHLIPLSVPSHPVLSPISSRGQSHLIPCSVPSHPVIIPISSRDHSHLIPWSVPSHPVLSPISSRGQSHLIPWSVPSHPLLSPISSRAQFHLIPWSVPSHPAVSPISSRAQSHLIPCSVPSHPVFSPISSRAQSHLIPGSVPSHPVLSPISSRDHSHLIPCSVPSHPVLSPISSRGQSHLIPWSVPSHPLLSPISSRAQFHLIPWSVPSHPAVSPISSRAQSHLIPWSVSSHPVVSFISSRVPSHPVIIPISSRDHSHLIPCSVPSQPVVSPISSRGQSHLIPCSVPFHSVLSPISSRAQSHLIPLSVPSHSVLSPISSRGQSHLIPCSVPSHPVIIPISSRDHSHLIPWSVPSHPVLSPISSRGQSHLIPWSVPSHPLLSPISSRAQFHLIPWSVPSHPAVSPISSRAQSHLKPWSVPSHPVFSPISSRAQSHLIPCSVPSHPVLSPISSRDHSHLIPCSVPSHPVLSPISSRGQSHLIPWSVPSHPLLSPISSRAQFHLIPWSVPSHSAVSPISSRAQSHLIPCISYANWADRVEALENTSTSEGYQKPKGAKRKDRDPEGNPAKVPKADNIPATPSQPPKRVARDAVIQLKNNRQQQALSKARSAAASFDQCCYIEYCADFSPVQYIKALEEMLGKGAVFQLMKMSGQVMVGLANVDLADRLVEGGLNIGTTFLRAFPYRQRPEKIVLGNLPLDIKDEDVIAALRPYCRVVSLTHEVVASSGYTWTTGNREVFVLLKDGIKLQQLPAKLVIVSKGESTSAYITYGVRCSKCHRQGHRRAACPLGISGERHQDTRQDPVSRPPSSKPIPFNKSALSTPPAQENGLQAHVNLTKIGQVSAKESPIESEMPESHSDSKNDKHANTKPAADGGHANSCRNWADCPEQEDQLIERQDVGFTKVGGSKKRPHESDYAKSGTKKGCIQAPGIPSNSSRPRATPRPSKVHECQTTRQKQATFRARSAAGQADQCVYLEFCADFTQEQYFRALEAKLGKGTIYQLTKMEGRILIGLSSVQLADKLIEEGLNDEDATLRAFPLRKRAERIVLGNVLFFVEDADFVTALRPYGQVTSIIQKMIQLEDSCWADARREAFITLRDGVKLSQIPARLDVKVKGVVTHIYVTYGIKCSLCYKQGHKRANCPRKTRLREDKLVLIVDAPDACLKPWTKPPSTSNAPPVATALPTAAVVADPPPSDTVRAEEAVVLTPPTPENQSESLPESSQEKRFLIAASIHSLPNGRASGWDGLPCEFAKAFEDFFAEVLWQVFEASRLRGALPSSSRRSKIILLPKSHGGPGIQAFRPISLSTTEYRVFGGVLMGRLRRNLPNIVPDCQTYAVPGRSSSWNIARVADNVAWAARHDTPLAIISLDLKSAFDSLSRNYLFALLAKLDLPSAFLGWITVLYGEADASIRIGDIYTRAFSLLNGVRQGCRLSAALFSIGVGPLLRRLERILGRGSVVAYVDDIVLFIRDDAQFKLVPLIFEEFCMASGEAVNFSKSCGLWYGSWRHRTDSPLGISWMSESLNILGLTITAGNTVASQASHLMGLLERAIARWSPFVRGLFLVGRARAANCLVLGSILHHLHGYVPPATTIGRLLARFVWGTSRVSWLPGGILARSVSEGGVGLLDIAGQLRLACLKGVQASLHGAANGYSWLVRSRTWMTSPAPDVWLSPRRRRLLSLWESVSSIFALNPRILHPASLKSLCLRGDNRFLRPSDLLTPDLWLQATVWDFSDGAPPLVRLTRAALLDAQHLGTFCQRLLQENGSSRYHA
ncbi:hypothetical protein LAZ67_3005969, partial [Cordylochernes scorpioides]